MKDCCKDKVINIIEKMNKLNYKTKQLQKALSKMRIVGPDEYVGKIKRK